VFVFEKKVAEKLHKPRRREVVTDLLRNEVSPAQVTAARAQSGREWVNSRVRRQVPGGRRGSSCRNEVSFTARLKHPAVLRVVHPLEESK